jgi:hypothetical protein
MRSPHPIEARVTRPTGKSNGVHKNNTWAANHENESFTKWQQCTPTSLRRSVNEVFTKTTHKIDLGTTLLRSGDAHGVHRIDLHIELLLPTHGPA